MIRAFEAQWSGLPRVRAVYKANSAGRARYLCALAVQDSFNVPVSRGLREIRVWRAPWADDRDTIGHRPEGTVPLPYEGGRHADP